MTFKSKLIAGISAALAILIFIGVLSYMSMARSRDDVFWVTHTHVVLENLDGVEAATLGAETSQRGFLLTGDASYLETYNDAIATAHQGLHEIRTLTADNPVQQRALDQIEPLINARIAVLDEVIAIRKRDGLKSAMAAVNAGQGKRAMDQVRIAVSGMDREEHELLAARTKEAASGATRMGGIIAIGDAVSFVFLFLAGTMIYQEMGRRRSAEEDVRELNDDLEKRVADRTAELRERTADLSRSNAELQQFAYVASHDLQEPLRMVASFTQLLAKRYNDKLGDDAREFIHYAVDGATRLQTLIGDLLNYSRVGTHAKPLQPTQCDAALDRVLASLKLAIHDTGTTITREPLPVVMADEVQLCQLFQNLLTNAMKFRSDKPSRVHIFAKREGDFWRISVRDNGIGIAPEHTDRIWVIFQRLHTKTEYPGTGIGLAICKKIAERHGGSIAVEPSPGGGSTFYFTIPVYKTQTLPEEMTRDEFRTAVATD
jgi:signal transduction histidine kinase